MKNILLINGSPKGKLSNTIKLTKAFLKGLNRNNEYVIDEINCSQVDVKDCKGCFYCWKNEEGRCAITDEMSDIIQKYISADIVIWSFPTYFYGMPSGVKRIMDRLLPLYTQELNCDDGETTYHPYRYNLEKQRYILFSSCAYYNTKQNVEPIKKQFELLYSNKCDMIFCPEGQLLSNEFMNYCTAGHLAALEAEGEIYRQCFKFSDRIKQKFDEPFLPLNEFLDFVEASSVTRMSGQTKDEYCKAEISSFFKALALTYDAERLMVEEAVLEIQITDYPYTCQLHMNKEKCILIENTENFVPYRLKVICKRSFFSPNQSFKGSNELRTQSPDFNKLIDLINKFAKKGLTRELKFC